MKTALPLALCAALLAAFVTARADTLRNRKTAETLDGKVLAVTERDGKALLVVRLATGKTRLLPATEWESTSEAETQIQKLRSSDPKEREAAIAALAKIGEPALKHLEPLAQDEDIKLAQAATRAILAIEGAMKPPARPAAPQKKGGTKSTKKPPAKVWKRPPPPTEFPVGRKGTSARPKTMLVMRDCTRCKGTGRLPCFTCRGRVGRTGSTGKRLKESRTVCFKCNSLGSTPCKTCGGRGKKKVRVNVPVRK
jgi:hypothetical protein